MIGMPVVALAVAFQAAGGANSGDKAGAYLYFFVALIAGIYLMWTIVPTTLGALKAGEVKTWGRGIIMRAERPGSFWFSIAMSLFYPPFMLFCAYLIYALLLSTPE
jgi:hypothetical protein